MKIQDLFEADTWAKKLAQANREKAKRERELAKAEAKIKAQQAKAAKPVTLTDVQIWSKVEDAISSSFPDGDPIDHLIPWMERNKVTMDQINKAVKKHGKAKDMYAYLAGMWDDMANDQVADARHGHVQESPFYRMENGQPVKNPNPWK